MQNIWTNEDRKIGKQHYKILDRTYLLQMLADWYDEAAQQVG